jgi:DNA-binding response OmpR family regulator
VVTRVRRYRPVEQVTMGGGRVRVLLVEDDDRVAGALIPALARRGLAIARLATGAGVLERVHEVDVILLDLGLPDIDGVTLCTQIRAVSDVAIIVVSARGEVDDRIRGLRAGADDYLVKPYDVEELLARVEAVRRRRPEHAVSEPVVIKVGDVSVDLARSRCSPSSRARAARCARASRCSPRCGGTGGPRRAGRSTSTSRPCGRSWAARR